MTAAITADDLQPASIDDRTVLRTPDARFEGLTEYSFAPHYVDIGTDIHLRVHYLDERPTDPANATGETVLLLHGNPTWSYLYRHVIPPLVAAGHRCIAPDLIGFGRSDKPVSPFAYTHQAHIDWLSETMFDRLDLQDLTMVGHDWGGMLGLRLLAEHPERFRRMVATNTGLDIGDTGAERAWHGLAIWLQTSQRAHPFVPGQLVDSMMMRSLDPAIQAGYNAPFPDETYLQGVRQFPLLIPISPHDEAIPALRRTWTTLETLHVPFLCAFSADDPIFHGDHSALSTRIPGATAQHHTTIPAAGHFVQEDQAPLLADIINEFIRST